MDEHGKFRPLSRCSLAYDTPFVKFKELIAIYAVVDLSVSAIMPLQWERSET